MDAAAFAHMQDQREWEVRSDWHAHRVQKSHLLTRVHWCVHSQLLMEYVIPFASMIKGAALPTLPAPPALPDYGTHKVRCTKACGLRGCRLIAAFDSRSRIS